MKKYSTKRVAELLGVCPQRISAKLKQGHFPNSHKCECGRSILIPEKDIFNQPKKRKLRYEKAFDDNNFDSDDC
jgi:hypothetical protein